MSIELKQIFPRDFFAGIPERLELEVTDGRRRRPGCAATENPRDACRSGNAADKSVRFGDAFGVRLREITVPGCPGIGVGVSSITFMTASTAIMQLRSDPTMRGRVLALQAIVFLGSTPIGGPILGWVCQQFGARWGVLIGGVSAVVAAGYGWRAVRRAESVAVRPVALDSVIAAH